MSAQVIDESTRLNPVVLMRNATGRHRALLLRREGFDHLADEIPPLLLHDSAGIELAAGCPRSSLRPPQLRATRGVTAPEPFATARFSLPATARSCSVSWSCSSCRVRSVFGMYRGLSLAAPHRIEGTFTKHATLYVGQPTFPAPPGGAGGGTVRGGAGS